MTEVHPIQWRLNGEARSGYELWERNESGGTWEVWRKLSEPTSWKFRFVENDLSAKGSFYARTADEARRRLARIARAARWRNPR